MGRRGTGDNYHLRQMVRYNDWDAGNIACIQNYLRQLPDHRGGVGISAAFRWAAAEMARIIQESDICQSQSPTPPPSPSPPPSVSAG